MKANAPEKLYIALNELTEDGRTFVLDHRVDYPFCTEYTRTDAFIEKAVQFFEENIKEEDCKFGSSEWTELKADYESFDSFVRAFRNYMKGE